MTSQAMQQGGLGLILTTLIITAPPMAASFFQGTMGHFTPASVFGTGASSRDSMGRMPGQAGYMPAAPANTSQRQTGAIYSSLPTPTAAQRENADVIKVSAPREY